MGRGPGLPIPSMLAYRHGPRGHAAGLSAARFCAGRQSRTTPIHPTLVMMLMMLVFWGLVIAGLVLGVRWLASQGRGAGGRDEALEILRQRYARGEIDK